MRLLVRAAIIGTTAAVLATTASTSAMAEDATVYSAGLGAKVKWVAYGDHLYITDQVADGSSAVATYQMGSGTQYFYWNSKGKGTTRHVDLDVPENRLIAVGAMSGEWQGTPTGGLDWNSISTTTVSTS
ncbi:hypothetical protein ACFVH0_08985 [Streptomyces sp. NPDC127117]|uniref:hypothetical protein n=1 Tax=Streptomyces sp. NPDC127117 TaxID=3345368 RepID=UPI0036379732